MIFICRTAPKALELEDQSFGVINRPSLRKASASHWRKEKPVHNRQSENGWRTTRAEEGSPSSAGKLACVKLDPVVLGKIVLGGPS